MTKGKFCDTCSNPLILVDIAKTYQDFKIEFPNIAINSDKFDEIKEELKKNESNLYKCGKCNRLYIIFAIPINKFLTNGMMKIMKKGFY